MMSETPLADFDRVIQGLLSPAEIERGLTDRFDNVRVLFADCCQNLSAAQIERGLTDQSSEVRLVFLQKYDLTLTMSQIERALTDENELNVTETFVRTTQNVLTNAQIERGLNSKYPYVRCAYINRNEFIPTTAQSARGFRLAEGKDNEFWVNKLDKEDENEAWRNAIARSIISDAACDLPTKKTRRAL